MANIRSRNGKWQVQVRRLGHAAKVKSFHSKSDAQRWARQMEAELDRTYVSGDTKGIRGLTISDVLIRYRDTVTVNKRGTKCETKRIDVFLRQDWSKLPLLNATPSIFSQYRDQRSKLVSSGTIIRELGLLRSIFETAKKEWELPLVGNPISQVKKPKAPEGRTRRLNPGELDALLVASDGNKSPVLISAIQLAIETGMRRGELLAMNWKDLAIDKSILHIPVTKTEIARSIPLTDRAIKVLLELQQKSDCEPGRILPMSANAFQIAWQRCKKQAVKDGCHSLADLHFHDLRHEAVSRFFELGLNPAEVASISGHRDLRMLLRYTHLKAENLVKKLRNPTSIQAEY